MDKRRPPKVPAKRACVSSAGMWSFQKEMSQGVKEGGGRKRLFNTEDEKEKENSPSVGNSLKDASIVFIVEVFLSICDMFCA